MTRSKNHHFVPKVLQRFFTYEKEKIWYAVRGVDGLYGPPILKDIEKTFRFRNYYTLFDGYNRSDIVERDFYGSLDNYLGKVLPDIAKSLANKRIPIFSDEDLKGIQAAVLAMAKRTPEFVRSVDEVAIGKEILEGTLTELSSGSEEERKIRQDLDNPDRLREYGRSVRVKGVVSGSPLIESELSDFSIRWAISSTRHSYILPSCLTYWVGNGGVNGFINPNLEIWMPISPKAVLVLCRDFDKRIPLVVEDNPDHIRKVNEYGMAKSSQIASHSKELLESLTGMKAIYP